MAARLKKRAYEEFSSFIQEAPPPKPPPKRLKLMKPTVATFSLDLDKLSSAQIMKTLISLSKSLPTDAEDLDKIAQKLVEHFYKEKETHIRAKVVSLIGQIASSTLVDSQQIANNLITLLKAETSHKVQVQLIASLTTIGQSSPHDSELHQKLIDLAQKTLSTANHQVRCQCLNLIGSLGLIATVSRKPESSTAGLLKILSSFTTNEDSRVRTSAFQAILALHERGQRLSMSLYDKACQALTDDYESVRMAALRIVWVICRAYPENIIHIPDSDEELRLVDDGFGKICQMITDSSITVRTETAKLMGSLYHVGPKFLEQTLDKKLMSNFRRKRTAHERQREHFESGEWSSGKKWADDAPKEEIDPETVTLMRVGACGAFVHGLEDEFLEVRTASLDALCELAVRNPAFARLSLDFLVDMFNDEISHVRINAIRILNRISQVIEIREDQLDIILSVLDDFSAETREAIHELLCCLHFENKSCLSRSLQSLMRNLQKYPQDKISIWKCCKSLGKGHADLTEQSVPEMLGTHPFFDIPEPDMEDPAYTAVMIIIYNAAEQCPNLHRLLPEFVFRHYFYHRDSLPNLVPHLQFPEVSMPEELKSPNKPLKGQQWVDGYSVVSADSFMQQTLGRLKSLDTLDTWTQIKMVEAAIGDLARVKEAEPSLSATAEFCLLYMKCQLLLAKAVQNKAVIKESSLLSCQNSKMETTIAEVFSISYKMEHIFLGLNGNDVAMLQQLRLAALTLELFLQLKGHIDNRKQSQLQLCVTYVNRLNELQRNFNAKGLEPGKLMQSVFAHIDQLEGAKPTMVLKLLQPLLTTIQPSVLIPSNQLHRVEVEVSSPSTNALDNPMVFTAGLALALDVDCNLDNIRHPHNCIQLEVKFPDGSVQYFIPKSDDFRKLSALQHRLVTKIFISHGVWSEPCHIMFSVVQTYKPEWHREGSPGNQAQQPSVLRLGNPVKIYISPKPSRR